MNPIGYTIIKVQPIRLQSGACQSVDCNKTYVGTNAASSGGCIFYTYFSKKHLPDYHNDCYACKLKSYKLIIISELVQKFM